MRVTSFAIEEIRDNGIASPESPERSAALFADPALVDVDTNPGRQSLSSGAVTVITPNLRMPTSVFLVLALSFEEGESDLQYNIGVFLTDPRGKKEHRHWWIVAPGPTVADQPDLPDDRSFRIEYAEFPFTFLREGRFLITLGLWIGNPDPSIPRTFEQWNEEFVEVLATLPIDVIDGGH